MSQHGPLEARDPAPVPVTVVPDPEVPEQLERARRRQFTVGDKLRILTEADTARTTGEIGGLLRRGGAYSPPLAARRPPRGEGGPPPLPPPPPGGPAAPPRRPGAGRRCHAN